MKPSQKVITELVKCLCQARLVIHSEFCYTGFQHEICEEISTVLSKYGVITNEKD